MKWAKIKMASWKGLFLLTLGLSLSGCLPDTDDTLTNPDGQPSNHELKLFWLDSETDQQQAANSLSFSTQKSSEALPWTVKQTGFLSLQLGRYEHRLGQWLPYPDTLDIETTSRCIEQEKAELVFQNQRLILGRVEIGYRPGPECIKDELQVRAKKQGRLVAASPPLVVDIQPELPAAAYAISFQGFYQAVAGQPYELPEEASQVELRPSGSSSAINLPEEISLRFQVVDAAGQPVVAKIPVDWHFQLIGPATSGLNASQRPRFMPADQTLTNSQGEAWVRVQAGSFPLRFNVLASLADTESQAASPQLAVSSGFADLSAMQLMAVEMDLEASDYIYQLVFALPDVLGNPLQATTSVSFRIDPQMGFAAAQCEAGKPAAGLCTLEAYLGSGLLTSNETTVFELRAEAFNQLGNLQVRTFKLEYRPGQGVFRAADQQAE